MTIEKRNAELADGIVELVGGVADEPMDEGEHPQNVYDAAIAALAGNLCGVVGLMISQEHDLTFSEENVAYVDRCERQVAEAVMATVDDYLEQERQGWALRN